MNTTLRLSFLLCVLLCPLVANGQGPKGGLRWGITYSYITKSGWSGNAGLAAATPGISPKAVDNMVWTSFRYYIP